MESQRSDNFPKHPEISAETGFSHKPKWMLGLQAWSCPSEVAIASQEEEKKRHQLLVWEKSQELPKTDWLAVSFGLAEIITVLCRLPLSRYLPANYHNVFLLRIKLRSYITKIERFYYRFWWLLQKVQTQSVIYNLFGSKTLTEVKR